MTLLLLIPWLLPIASGIGMSVVYRRGEPIGPGGYWILGGMFVPLLLEALLCLRRRYLDLDCSWCGRAFYSTDLPKILHSGRCPACGQTVPDEDLRDYR